MPDLDNSKTIVIKELDTTIVLYDEKPDHKIVDTRFVDTTTWGCGSVTGSLREICKYCGEAECDMDCFEFGEACTDRDSDVVEALRQDRQGFLAYNGAVDVLESMLLAHACAGIDVADERYVQGIQTALQALGNNL